MFKLNFDIPSSKRKINLTQKIYLAGSCFSNEIGSLLEQYKFKVLSNPFGTVYNPTSICKHLEQKTLVENTVESQGVFYHWDCHGSISGLTNDEVNAQFSSRRAESASFLEGANWLIVTLGTSIVYRLKSTNEIVANCHKVPTSQFYKSYLSVDEITSNFESSLSYLNQHNPELNIIFTVSPVRHIKDGLVENNLSKSILLEAVHQMVNTHSNVDYFPSYEIMIDELRDYRFYKKDMIHPSEEAIEYIWNQFTATFFDNDTLNFISEWSKIKAAISHKPFQFKSEKHQQFLKSTLKKLEKMNDLVDTSVEKELIRNQLL